MRKLNPRRSLVLSCGLLLSLIVVVGLSSRFTPAMPLSLASIPARYQAVRTGHYNLAIHVLSGPNAGKTEFGTYDIGSDGLVAVTLKKVGTGHGTLFSSGDKNGTLILTFRGVLSKGQDVQITLIVTQITRDSFTAQGYGVLYDQNEPKIQKLKFNIISEATLAP